MTCGVMVCQVELEAAYRSPPRKLKGVGEVDESRRDSSVILQTGVVWRSIALPPEDDAELRVSEAGWW